MISFLTMLWCFCACVARTNVQTTVIENVAPQDIISPGAYQIQEYLPLLKSKSVAAVVNHTSMIGTTHLVDSLIKLNVPLNMIFAPEHGFKGTAYNGEEIKDDLYKGKIPIRSLYGKSRKPSKADLAGIDVIVYDIQDVGARFYTYVSTLHYVMESAAENNKEVIILDRPNPNGHYIDGPVMEDDFKSFVGMHNVPIVYGMTIGEYAQMINGQGWLKDGRKCKLRVIPVSGYRHELAYQLPIAPSPNLPNYRSILLYPSLCLLEGTVINEGRGTDKQFQIYGHPDLKKDNFSYTPMSMTSSKYPKHEGVKCGGVDLTELPPNDIFLWGQLNLDYVIQSYRELNHKIKEPFFLKNGWFNKLAGNATLMRQIEEGITVEEIRKSWEPGLAVFKKIRSKYLIYP